MLDEWEKSSSKKRGGGKYLRYGRGVERRPGLNAVRVWKILVSMSKVGKGGRHERRNSEMHLAGDMQNIT